MFEWGVASTITPLRFGGVFPDGNLVVRAKREGFETVMREMVWRVFELDMFNDFYRSGWNRRLARLTRHQLVPMIIQTVMLAWLLASERAADKRAAKR